MSFFDLLMGREPAAAAPQQPSPVPVPIARPQGAELPPIDSGADPTTLGFDSDTLKKFVRAFAAGMGARNSNPQSIVGSIGSGLSGASGYNEYQENLAKKQESDLAKSKADAAQRKFENELLLNKDSRESSAEGRAATKDKFGNLKTAADIDKLQREASINGLSLREMLSVEEQVSRYARTMKSDFDPLGEESQEKVERYRQELIDRSLKAKQGGWDGSGAPATPGPANPGTGLPPIDVDPNTPVSQGDGSSEQSPIMVASETDAAALPQGSFFVFNGTLYRRK